MDTSQKALKYCEQPVDHYDVLSQRLRNCKSIDELDRLLQASLSKHARQIFRLYELKKDEMLVCNSARGGSAVSQEVDRLAGIIANDPVLADHLPALD